MPASKRQGGGSGSVVAQVDRAYLRTAGFATLRRLVSYAAFEGRPATTRGQWVNPLVLGHLRAAARYGAATEGPDRPVFIVGVGRSGTTHLGRLLSVHKGVGWLNEPKAMWHCIEPDEDVSGFYAPLGGRLRWTAADVSDAARGRAWRLYRYYARMTASERVVDKYPELTYRIGYLREMFPDAKIVGIVRRPEAFSDSVQKWSAQHTRQRATRQESWWGVDDRKWHSLWQQLVLDDDTRRRAWGHVDPGTLSDRQRATVEWIVAMEELLGWSGDGTPDLIVRYEDLTRDPVRVLQTVLHAVELEADPRVLRHAQQVTEPFRSAAQVETGILAPAMTRALAALGY